MMLFKGLVVVLVAFVIGKKNYYKHILINQGACHIDNHLSGHVIPLDGISHTW